MSDFLDLAAARASGELKGTVSSSIKVISGLEMSTRSGLEVVVLMSVGTSIYTILEHELVAVASSLAYKPSTSSRQTC